MRQYTFNNNGFTFKRIARNKARAAYRAGLRVVMCPVNLRPFGEWSPEIIADAKSNGGTPWSDIINAFEWYNCNNNEVGKYAAFYIPVRSVDRFTGEPSEGGDVIQEYDYKYLEV